MGSTSLASLDRGDHIILNRRNIPGRNYQWILILPLKSASGTLIRWVWVSAGQNNSPIIFVLDDVYDMTKIVRTEDALI